jgi:hypothetical protein
MSRRLLTADDFIAWQRGNEAMLQEALAENQARVDDEVIRQVMRMLSGRVDLEQAGDMVLKTILGSRNGVTFTREGVRDALLSIGWVPPSKRKGGAHE